MEQNEVVEIKQTHDQKDEKQVSFEIGYIIPFWSSKPLYKYSLDLWRDGIITDTIQIIGKEYYLFGRNKDVCDIYIGNMTVSRVHCVLQHKDDGDVFLYDLESVYGTFINKRPITKKTYVKLNVGDTFRLGKSGRMFILNGPNELMPDEDNKPIQITDRKTLMEKRVNQLTELYNKSEEYKRNLLGLNSDSVDWGQKDFDDEIRKHEKMVKEEEDDKEGFENEYLGALNLEKLKLRKDLTEKQRKMITKMENLQTGINKLKDENSKIKKKEADRGELTEGQTKRLSINEEKLKELYEKFELMEDNLRLSLSSKDGINQAEVRFDKKLAKEIVSDDDEFYDRAKLKEKNTDNRIDGSQVVGNYETLKKSLEECIRTRQKLLDKLQKVDSDVLNENKDNIDSLDLYMNENFSNIVSSQKERLTSEISNLSKEISKTQKLISFVTPSFIKIKFKDDANKPLVGPTVPVNTEKAEFVDNNEDIEQAHNVKSLSRDTEALKNPQQQMKKKKKEGNLIEYLQKFDKMKKKWQNQAFKKFTDSDEEILEEAETFKNRIDEEIADELKEKRKVVLKEIEKLKMYQEKFGEKGKEEEEESGGLIIKKKTKEEGNSYFNEIINNIGKTEFDIGNYSSLNSLINKKQDDKNKKKIDKNIDYSVGGLQTFLDENLKQLDPQNKEVKYMDDDVDFLEDNENFHKKKRERYIEAPTNKLPKKVYGVTPKPVSRNQDDQDEEYDYDAVFIPQDKYSKGHDLSGNERKYRKNEED
jgi:pSer/pThr/pTyr-binding forkhead associated (FHA) protein